MLKQLPCKGCITFPMCKVRYRSLQDQYGNYELIVRQQIMQNCSILENFYHRNDASGTQFHLLFMEIKK